MKAQIKPCNMFLLKKIKNSLNHYENDDIQKTDKLHQVFNDDALENTNKFFNSKNYNFSGNELAFSKKTMDIGEISTENANKADSKAFEYFLHDLEDSSYFTWIVFAILLSLLALFVFQCTFIPISYEIYKKRNKKSRRKEARMTKKTHYLHLILHTVATILIVVFISFFAGTVSDLEEKTKKQSFDFLRVTKNYYSSLRLQQVADLKHLDEIDLSNNNSTNQLNEQSMNITESLNSSFNSTLIDQSFLAAAKAIHNTNAFVIPFPSIKSLYFQYLFEVDCDLPIISENGRASALCQKHLDNKQRLQLGYLVKYSQTYLSSSYTDIFDDQLVRDHFQIRYCHHLIHEIEQVLMTYIAQVHDDIVLFYFQFVVCLAFLLIFWYPFFKDSEHFKKEARRFEMVNQI